MAFSLKSTLKKRGKGKKKPKKPIEVLKVTSDKISQLRQNISENPNKDHSIVYAGIVRHFFMKLLKIRYHFTSQEFENELKRKRLSPELKLEMINFFNELSDMEFRKEGYSSQDLHNHIRRFEELVPKVLKEKKVIEPDEKKGFFANLFSKLHLKKKAPVEPEKKPKQTKPAFHISASFGLFRRKPGDQLTSIYNLVAEGYEALAENKHKKAESKLAKIDNIYETLERSEARQVKKEIASLRKEITGSSKPLPKEELKPLPELKTKPELQPEPKPELAPKIKKSLFKLFKPKTKELKLFTELPPPPLPEIEEEPIETKPELEPGITPKPSVSGMPLRLKDKIETAEPMPVIETKLEEPIEELKPKLSIKPILAKKTKVTEELSPLAPPPPPDASDMQEKIRVEIEKDEFSTSEIKLEEPKVAEPEPIVEVPKVEVSKVEVPEVAVPEVAEPKIVKKAIKKLAKPKVKPEVKPQEKETLDVPVPKPFELDKPELEYFEEPVQKKLKLEDLSSLQLETISKGGSSFKPKPIFVPATEKEIRAKPAPKQATVQASKTIQKQIAKPEPVQKDSAQIEDLENMIQTVQYLINNKNFTAAMEMYTKALKVKDTIQLSREDATRISYDLQGIDLDLKLSTLT